MTKIYFFKSGETESNLTHLVCGQADDPLTENGKEQARLAGAALAKRHFDIVYASPLERTMQTAKAIVGMSTKHFTHQLFKENVLSDTIFQSAIFFYDTDQNESLGSGFNIQVDNLLLERSFGKFEKVRIIDHVMAGMRVGYKTAGEFWNDYAPDSVETMGQVMDRTIQFFDVSELTLPHRKYFSFCANIILLLP